MSNKYRSFASHLHQPILCTRTHQIAALALVATTFFLTRFFDRTFFAPCASSGGFTPSIDRISAPRGNVRFDSGGLISWPERGFGSRLDLKIYVYDENEIDGLKSLLYGRDGTISADECVKGQWGTQVVSTPIVLSCVKLSFVFVKRMKLMVDSGMFHQLNVVDFEALHCFCKYLAVEFASGSIQLRVL